MTYSIGFRAPALEDIASAIGQSAPADWSEADRFCDPPGFLCKHPHEIAAETLDGLANQLALDVSREELCRTFGRLVTEPRRGLPAVDWRSEEPAPWPSEGMVGRYGESRLAFASVADQLLFFADGFAESLPRNSLDGVKFLLGSWKVAVEKLAPYREELSPLVGRLLAADILYWEEQEP